MAVDFIKSKIDTIETIYQISQWQLQQLPYKYYLKTEHWTHFKNEALKFYNWECQLCGKSDFLNVHHRNYDNIGRETFNDVIVLCRGCHGKQHGRNEP